MSSSSSSTMPLPPAFLQVLQDANAPAFGVHVDGTVTLWNNKIAFITGFTAAEVVGHLLQDFVIGDSARDAIERSVTVADQSSASTREVCMSLRTACGRNVLVASSLTLVFNEDGLPLGVYGIGQEVTERNAKEMEYRKFIDSANAPIFGVDLQGRVVIFNKKAAETSEYLPEEIMGANLLETLISEEFRPTVKTVLQNAFEGVETANVEFPLLTKGGRKMEILLNVTPRYDHLGNLCGAIGIGQDITDRIIQEQEYSRLIDTANAALFAIDPSGLVSAWNRKASKITRSQHDEVMGKSFVETFVPDDYKEFVNYVFAKALEGVETSNFEFPLITKAGERVTMLLNVSPQTRENGEVTGVIAVGQDITYRVADNEEYIHLIDTANTPICTVDGDGCVNVWNEKMVKITQFTADEVVGESFVHTVVEESHRAMLTDVMRRAHRGEESANFEVVLTTKTARSVRLLMSATTRYNKHCGIVGVLLIGLEV